MIGDDSVLFAYSNELTEEQSSIQRDKRRYRNERYKRYQSSWILFPEIPLFTVTVGGRLKFELRWPKPTLPGLQGDDLDIYLGEQDMVRQRPRPAYMPDYLAILAQGQATHTAVYVPFQELGRGGQGTVCRVLEASSGRVYACKYFEKEFVRDFVQARTQFRQEVSFMRRCHGHVSLMTSLY